MIEYEADKVLELHRPVRQGVVPLSPANRPSPNHGGNCLRSPPSFDAVPDNRRHDTEEKGKVAPSHTPGQSTHHGVSDVMGSSGPL